MKTVPYSRRLRLQNIFSNLVTRIIVPLFRSCSTFSFYFKLVSPSFINQCYLFKIVQDLLVWRATTRLSRPYHSHPLQTLLIQRVLHHWIVLLFGVPQENQITYKLTAKTRATFICCLRYYAHTHVLWLFCGHFCYKIRFNYCY